MTTTTPPRRATSRRAALAGLAATAASALAVAPRATRAQGTPPASSAPPLRIVVPAPPGGPTDILARVLAERVGGPLNRAVVVDNRPGAGGIVGAEAVARAAPDGNTVVLGHNQTHASNQWMARNLPYHVVDSFAPVARLAAVHHALVVPATGPDRTLADLLARGRAGRLTYASSQAGSASHVISEALARRARLAEATHVPYRGAAPAATDTVAGVVDWYVATFPTVAGLIRDGRLRVLAVGAPVRLADFPDVPTAAEAGFGDVFVDAWFGLFAPRGTPAAAVGLLSGTVLDALEEPTVRARLEAAGFALAPQAAGPFARFQAEEVARWRDLAELTGVRMDG